MRNIWLQLWLLWQDLDPHMVSMGSLHGRQPTTLTAWPSQYSPNACIVHLLKQPGAYSTATYTSWSCGDSGSTRIALATPTNGDGSGGGDGGGNGNGNGLRMFCNPISRWYHYLSNTTSPPAAPTLQFPGQTTSPATGNGNSNGGSGSGANSNANNGPAGSSSSPSLTPGAIAGIAVGSALGALLIAGVVWFAVRSRPKKVPPNYSQTVVSGWLDQAH